MELNKKQKARAGELARKDWSEHDTYYSVVMETYAAAISDAQVLVEALENYAPIEYTAFEIGSSGIREDLIVDTNKDGRIAKAALSKWRGDE